jgi:hypothetical protein
MSSPHVAGIGALLKQAHPNWTPAALRSALATTAHQEIVGGYAPFNNGSGQIVPNKAVDPGLVYDAGFNDYRGFLRGQGLCTFCFVPAVPGNEATAIDASGLNQPSIAFGDLAGTQTVTRRVTNVGLARATYTATVTAPAGYIVEVTPSTLTLAPGASTTFSVAVTRTDAPLNIYRFGAITWSDGPHSVRSPLVVRAVAIAAPAAISGTTAAGSQTYSVKFGYSGTFNAVPRGLVAATKTGGSVADDPSNDFITATPDANQGFTVHTFVVPAGTKYLRFATFNTDVDGAHDLDMYVYRGATGATLVGASGGGTSDEVVNLVNPIAETYRVYIHGWQTAGGGTANYTLFSWQVPSTSANFTVSAPATATLGTSANITASWSGLSAATRYLGLVTYDDGTTEHGRTVFNVNVP